ncbi:MAG TPA: MBOAT family O-acyltransferase [Bacteroidia bacterium]|nr:MBOAT family O-acyltransferase [Bacteroidia bacterium]
MLFNSFQFLVFFPVVTLIYFLLPHKWRWIHLLIASCIFYLAFIPVYIFILFFTIIIDYVAGRLIEKAEGKKRKRFLTLSIVANVGVLCVFKYYNFFIGNIDSLLQHLHITTYSIPLLNIILPIGLSFHTFQAMSYTIEVYRGKQQAEKHIGIYALYVMFYPQLVAGPIERPQNLLPQFRIKHTFDYERVTDGLKLMLWGMFKKVVIADRLAQFVDPAFTDPHKYHPSTLLVATIFFAFQIFCDFSGYSDIAIGAAKVMGFKLMTNFNRPYHAKNISEFWTRWHISLSTWFRDYLYISIGGNRVSIPRWYFNLFFVFLVSGLWHGANWTFLYWGALHGFYVIFAIVTRNFRTGFNKAIGLEKAPRLYNFLQILTTFVLVDFAYIFFRAKNMKDAFFIINELPSGAENLLRSILSKDVLGYIITWNQFLLSVGVIIFLEGVQYLQGKMDVLSFLKQKPVYFRWAVYYAILLGMGIFGVFNANKFIYFQF